MLFFPSQNENKIFPDQPRVLKKQQTRVMANQHIFKSVLSLAKIF